MERRSETTTGIILALIAGVAIYGLAMGTTYPLIGIVLSEQVSGFWNGISAAATGIGLVVGVVLVSQFGRRFGPGILALFGVAIMALSLVALAVVQDYWTVFVARLFLGCGANLLFVVSETALNVFTSDERRGRVMGVYSASVAFGFVAGPAVVAGFSDWPGLILAGCAVVTALALLPIGAIKARVDRRVEPTRMGEVGPALAAYPFAFGFLLVASAIDAVAISLLPVIALDQSFSTETAALFVAVFHIGLLVGQPPIGFALDHFGRRRTVLGCCLCSLACAVLLIFGGHWGSWPTAGLLLIWGGANFGLYTAGLALIGDRFVGSALTAATAAFATVYAVASAVSPVLAGGAVDTIGASGFYGAVAAIYLITFLLGAFRFRPAEPSLSGASGDHKRV